MVSIYKAITELEELGQMAVLCTIVESKGSTPRHQSSKMLVYQDGKILGSVGGGEIENRIIQESSFVMSEGKARLLNYKLSDPQAGDPGICGGQVSVYLEPVGRKDKLLIIGAGHVGKAVAKLGKWLGFYVIVSDDRGEFCTPDIIPDADEFIICKLSQLPGLVDIKLNLYMVLCTRGSDVDVEGLPEILKNDPMYIGIIGSKKRWLHTKKRLLEMGILEEALVKIHSPIGIELQAETPEEIAVSILAEILMARNNGTGKPMAMQGV